MTSGLTFTALALLQSLAGAGDVRLALACGTQPSELLLTMRNQGPADTAVRLGLALANGQRYEPKEVTIELRRAGRAELEELVFNGPASIAGRIDHWVLPLPVDAEFRMTLRSADFISKTQPTPREEPESLTILLTGRAITSDLNPDMGGLKALRVWTGTARSNQLRLSECAREP